MATTATDTAEQELVLTPPEPVKAVAPAKAAGLVPVEDGVRSKLDEKVDAFVDDLVAQDVNSPEFGKRVDAITAMGQKEIREAAGQSNRFLDRPIRAMGNDSELAEVVGMPAKRLRKISFIVGSQIIAFPCRRAGSFDESMNAQPAAEV